MAYSRPHAGLLVALALPALVYGLLAQAPQAKYDLLIRRGLVVDGTGAPGFTADVAITGDRIALVSREPVEPATAREFIDAAGLVVSPGFVDLHAHLEALGQNPGADNLVRQGITTVVASPHGNTRPWPADAELGSLETSPNVGFLVGHSWVRGQVLGRQDREPSPFELDKMRALVEDGMRRGALGLSSGLAYAPANFAKTVELVELARVAARRGGIYMTHLRNESGDVQAAIAEALQIGEDAGLPVHVNHLGFIGAASHGAAEKALAQLDAAKARGVDVTFDVLPYTSVARSSTLLFPPWVFANSANLTKERLTDKWRRQAIAEHVGRMLAQEWGGGDFARVRFAQLPSDRRHDGKTLAELLTDQDKPATVESAVRLVTDLQLAGGFLAIFSSLRDEDVDRLLRHPAAMLESDAGAGLPREGFPHPGEVGAFPRFLGEYVRERRLLPLEDAVKRLTSQPAQRLGQTERGRVVEGAFADLTVFDAATIADRATESEPRRFPSGIVHVIVNGVAVVRSGETTGAKPGRLIKGPARKPATASRVPPEPAPSRVARAVSVDADPPRAANRSR